MHSTLHVGFLASRVLLGVREHMSPAATMGQLRHALAISLVIFHVDPCYFSGPGRWFGYDVPCTTDPITTPICPPLLPSLLHSPPASIFHIKYTSIQFPVNVFYYHKNTQYCSLLSQIYF